MSKQITLDLPQDAESVTLNIPERRAGATLRDVLPQIESEVELVIKDEFGTNTNPDADLYRLRAGGGNTLLHKLARSRIVDGESLLDLMPNVKLVEPQTSLMNGTFATLTGTGYIQLTVKPYMPRGKHTEERDANS